VNVRTAIAVAEGPAFEPAPGALNSQNIGFDFNPTVDKIRVTSDADDNIRQSRRGQPALEGRGPDEHAAFGRDGGRLRVHELVFHGRQADSDRAVRARRGTEPGQAVDPAPANNGTLIMPVTLTFNLGKNAGFDIAGSKTSATSPARGPAGRRPSSGGLISRPARRVRWAASATAARSPASPPGRTSNAERTKGGAAAAPPNR
jgi:Domain of unknown function (DUF4394)